MKLNDGVLTTHWLLNYKEIFSCVADEIIVTEESRWHYVYIPNINFPNDSNPNFNSGERRSGNRHPLDSGRSGIHPLGVDTYYVLTRHFYIRECKVRETVVSGMVLVHIRETCIRDKDIDPSQFPSRVDIHQTLLTSSTNLKR